MILEGLLTLVCALAAIKFLNNVDDTNETVHRIHESMQESHEILQQINEMLLRINDQLDSSTMNEMEATGDPLESSALATNKNENGVIAVPSSYQRG